MVGDACYHCGRDSYRSPSVVVDAVATRNTLSGKEVLQSEGDTSPVKICWHSPVDLLKVRGEDPEDAVKRELLEETGIIGSNPISHCFRPRRANKGP